MRVVWIIFAIPPVLKTAPLNAALCSTAYMPLFCPRQGDLLGKPMSIETNERQKPKDAPDHLPDRRVFLLSDADWKAFMSALDAPAKPNPRLARLFNEPSVFG